MIIGENSYIGKSFAEFAADKHEITTISSRDGTWRYADFAGFDAVLHCAGIAHVKQTKRMKPLYFDVNCDLAVEIARRAKDAGIGQFVFLSSMAVYGNSVSEIDGATPPNPNIGDYYGASKLQAENELGALADEKFKLSIVRPPMVYGKNCKGNFQRLVKLAKIMRVFPDYPNRRSMIFIDNLSSFLCGIIESGASGIFLPQNKEYVNTTELVGLIAEYYGKRITTTKLFNPLIRALIKKISVFDKMFGDLFYTKHTQHTNNYKHTEHDNNTNHTNNYKHTQYTNHFKYCHNNDAVNFAESVRLSVM